MNSAIPFQFHLAIPIPRLAIPIPIPELELELLSISIPIPELTPTLHNDRIGFERHRSYMPIFQLKK